MRAIIFFFVLSSQAAAQSAVDCARIENPDDRLSCYDGLFLEVATPSPAADSSWQVQITDSALDDSRRVILIVESNEPLRGRFGVENHGQLMLRCQENTTNAFIYFGGHFMSDLRGGGRVDYRVDRRDATRVSMTNSNDNQALGLWRGGTAIPFIRDLFGGSDLYVRATPFSESRIEMNFNITGLEEAIAPLREACNW